MWASAADVSSEAAVPPPPSTVRADRERIAKVKGVRSFILFVSFRFVSFLRIGRLLFIEFI